MSAQPLVKYDAMVFAIAECHKVDEVKDIHNKALAMELYAKQAMNTDAERQATDIRLRAERKAGELMSAMQRTSKADAGAKGNLSQGKNAPATIAAASQYKEALNTAGINERTARRWQELAAVPKKTFEDALRNPDKKPTTTGILATAKGAPKMNDDALWIWGRLRDFERLAMWDKDAGKLFDGMTNTMQDDLRRILPHVTDWLGELMEKTDEA